MGGAVAAAYGCVAGKKVKRLLKFYVPEDDWKGFRSGTIQYASLFFFYLVMAPKKII
jgi:hypothetical protein